jgi:ureidoacrylate peracid hydrolase
MASMGALVTVEARPEPMTVDLTRSAVIVVDMQNDFGSEGGMFARGGVDISGIRAAVAPTARILAAARRAGVKVVYLKMGFRPDLSDAGAPDAPSQLKHAGLRFGETVKAPDGTESRILIRDTWNTDILDELTPGRGDIVLYKHRYSGFYGTDLDAILRNLGVRYLIFTGCTTSICVESTVRDAMFRDYHCLVLADCMAEPIGNELPRSNHEASLLVMQAGFGWVSDSSAFLTVVERQLVASGPRTY